MPDDGGRPPEDGKRSYAVPTPRVQLRHRAIVAVPINGAFRPSTGSSAVSGDNRPCSFLDFRIFRKADILGT